MFKFLFLSLFIGTVSGCLSSAFLYALKYVTSFRLEHPLLILGLPFFGLLFGFVVQRLPHGINQGVPYLIKEMENDHAPVSPWMTPFIFLSSLGSHLFGGSIGREGVGVIMGASSAQLLPFHTKSFRTYRKPIIYSGMAAGFASIFGTPLAAILFVFELHGFKDFKKYDVLFSSISSSFVAFFVSYLLGPDHGSFKVSFEFSPILAGYVLLVGFLSGFAGHLYFWGLRTYTKLISSLVPQFPTKLFVGSVLISALAYLSNGHSYLGIGTDLLQSAFHQPMTVYDFMMKCIFTVMTIAIGFKGGEVTPLFIMGALLANSSLSMFGLDNYALSSSLGMVSLFGAVTATPLASAMMGAELFGLEIGIMCLFTCILSKKITGPFSVYRL